MSYHKQHPFKYPLIPEKYWLNTCVPQLLQMQCGNGLMHESVNVMRFDDCTRPVFEWANSLLVVLVEHLLGRDCTARGLAHHQDTLLEQHASKKRGSSAGGVPAEGVGCFSVCCSTQLFLSGLPYFASSL